MLKYLLTLFPLFLPFAAGPPALGGGGGAPSAPSGGGDGSGGGTGAEPTIGWAGDEPGGTDGAEHSEADEGGEGSFQEESDEFSDQPDSASAEAGAPKSLKEFVDKITNGLHSEDPNIKHAAEKELKKVYSERQRYQAQFKTPEALRDFTEKVEVLGGLEGIEQEHEATNQFLEGWKSGDEATLSKWMEDNADGLAASMPKIANLWAKSDPQSWAHHMASTFMATWKDPGQQGVSALAAFNSLSKNTDLVALAEKNPAVRDAFNRIAEVINAVDENTKQSAARDLSPEKQKLDQREKTLKQKEAQIADERLNSRIAPVMNTSAKRAIASVFKGRKFTPEQQKELLADVVNEFSRMSKKDTEFQKNARALKAAGETEKFEKLCNARFERFMPLAARNIHRKYTGIGGLSDAQKQQRQADGQGRRESGGGSTGGNSIRTTAPTTYAQTQEIDWDMMAGMAKKHGAADKESMFQDKRLFYKKGDKRLYSF